MGRDIVGSGTDVADGVNYVLGEDVGAATVSVTNANLPSDGDQPITMCNPVWC
jgi:hypothetical protein